MVIRGTVQDRLWGKTLGAFARHRASGQLVVRQRDVTYQVAFQDGAVVAATAPIAEGMALMLAYRQQLVSPDQVATIEYRRREGADPFDLLTTVAGLRPIQIHTLRRQVIAACTMRTFVLEAGEFEMTPEITLEVWPETALPLGNLIYRGARAHLSATRLEAAIRQLGGRFQLQTAALSTLSDYGFGEAELAVVRRLARGITASEIGTIHQSERHMVRATIYALAACGAVDCTQTKVTIPPRLARGTVDTIPTFPDADRSDDAVVRFSPRASSVADTTAEDQSDKSGPIAPSDQPTPL